MNKTYYIDIENWLWVDASGARLSKYPALLANTVESWELHFVTASNAAVDLSNAATFKASVDDDFDHGTDPMCRTLNAGIDSSHADDGILVITFDTRTSEYSTAVGTAKQISAYVEILGLDGDDIPIHSVLLDCIARNCIDPDGGTPPTPIPANYSFTTTNPPVPDPAAESKEYWIDVEKEVWIDVNGGIVNRYPPLQYGSTPQWKLHFMSLKTGVPVAVNLSAYTAYHIAAHTSYKATTPAIRCLNDSIDSSEIADGILYAAFDSRNTVFSGCVGTSKEASANIEILGFASGLPAFSVILPVTFKNAVDPVGGTPPAVVGNYYTKAEADSLLLNKASTTHATTHAPAGSDALPWSTAHGKGTEANRPAAAATNLGYLYYNETAAKLQRSNGSTWDDVSGAGTIAGSTGSTDNALLRADGTGGATLQASLVTVDDSGGMNIPSGQTYNINGSPHTHAYEAAGAVSSHAALTTGVHGVGAGTIAKTSDIPALSSTTPSNLGTAAVGDGTTTARSNHVHNMPSSSDVGALAQTDWNKIDRCGFVDLTQCSISFEASNQTLTITGTTWQYFRAGILYTISGNKTKALTSDTAGTYFFYIDATDGTISYSTISWTLLDTKIPVAIVIYGKTTTPAYMIADERHQCLIDRRLHWYEHSTSGTKWISGGVLADYSVAQASPTDAENTFSISEALIADEDMRHTLAEMTNPSGTGTDYLIVYRTGASTWTWETSAVPFRYTAAGYIQYDDNGTMKQGAQTKAYNTYLAFTNAAGQQARHIIIHGRQEFANATAAYAEDVRNFSLTGLPFVEMVIVYQLTWETGSSYSTKGKCRLARAPQRINTSVTAVNNPAQSSDHNSLLNLQGGASASSEYYHLTSANATAVGAATDANTASAIVKRDASGNFAAGTITAALNGTASGNIPAVTPGTSGNILTSNGSAWESVTPSTGVYSTTFTNSDNRISTGVLTVTHNLGQRPLFIVMMDGSANPVDVSALAVYTSVNAFTVDLTNFGTLSGTWTLIASKGAGASVAAGFTNPMTTAGDLITATTGGTPARLAMGSGLQVLRVNSGATALEYATPSAGGMWSLQERYTVAGSAVTSKTFTVDGNTDRRYKLVTRMITNTASSNLLTVTFNADTTAAHYPSRNMRANGSDGNTVVTNLITVAGCPIGYTAASGEASFGAFEIDAATGAYRMTVGSFARLSGTGVTEYYPYTCVWLDQNSNNTNITAIVLTSGVSSGIAVGSYFELWKLAQ